MRRSTALRSGGLGRNTRSTSSANTYIFPILCLRQYGSSSTRRGAARREGQSKQESGRDWLGVGALCPRENSVDPYFGQRCLNSSVASALLGYGGGLKVRCGELDVQDLEEALLDRPYRSTLSPNPTIPHYSNLIHISSQTSTSIFTGSTFIVTNHRWSSSENGVLLVPELLSVQGVHTQSLRPDTSSRPSYSSRKSGPPSLCGRPLGDSRRRASLTISAQGNFNFKHRRGP